MQVWAQGAADSKVWTALPDTSGSGSLFPCHSMGVVLAFFQKLQSVWTKRKEAKEVQAAIRVSMLTTGAQGSLPAQGGTGKAQRHNPSTRTGQSPAMGSSFWSSRLESVLAGAQ